MNVKAHTHHQKKKGKMVEPPLEGFHFVQKRCIDQSSLDSLGGDKQSSL